MLKDSVIVDVDGTLAEFNPELVKDLVLGEHKDWIPFFELMEEAQPVKEIKRLVDILKASGQSIVICSGRPAKHQNYTVRWLEKHNIPFDGIYLRAETDDHLPDEIVKSQLLQKMEEDGFNPWLVIDDRTAVVNFWRNAGLCCLQCAPGDF